MELQFFAKKKEDEEPEDEENKEKEEILGRWQRMEEKLDRLLQNFSKPDPEENQGTQKVPVPPEKPKEEKEETKTEKKSSRGFLSWLW
jgi:hypothetical protein